ncbi:MAG: hypothetical protein HFE84_09385 [Lachnospiraceae bacterium]|nr:hypothetical protein [Lachnospiraceae bacterium]
MRRTGKYVLMLSLAAMAAVSPMTSYGWGFKKAAAETTASAELVYEFKTEQAVIAMGAEAAPIVKALGATKSQPFSSDSCAYQGKSTIYPYEGFELGTHTMDGKETVESVYLTNATYATPEGIKVGSTKQAVMDAYGKTAEDAFGTLRYTRKNTQVSFYFTNGAVDSVEYVLIVAE